MLNIFHIALSPVRVYENIPELLRGEETDYAKEASTVYEDTAFPAGVETGSRILPVRTTRLSIESDA